MIHARADRDESAYHIHAVILPRVEIMVNGAPRKMLQPSKFAVIKDYEKLQDSVGIAFSTIGLARGERRKQALREALARGEAPPESPRHVRPKAWREEQERKLAGREAEIDVRETAVEEREGKAARREETAEAAIQDAEERSAEADAVLALVGAVAEGQVEIADGNKGPKLTAAADADPEQVREVLRRANRSPTGKTKALGALARVWTGLKSKARASADAKLARERDEVRKAETALARERDALRGDRAEISRDVEELSLAWAALSQVIKTLSETVRHSIASLLSDAVRRKVGIESRQRRREADARGENGDDR